MKSVHAKTRAASAFWTNLFKPKAAPTKAGKTQPGAQPGAQPESELQSEPKPSSASAGKEPKRLPIIGLLKPSTQYLVVIGLSAFLALSSVGVAYVANSLTNKLEFVRAEVRASIALVERMSTILSAVSGGDASAFEDAASVQEAISQKTADLSVYASKLSVLQRLQLPQITLQESREDFLWKSLVGTQADLTPVTISLIGAQQAYDRVLMKQPTFGAFINAANEMRALGPRLANLADEIEGSGLAGLRDLKTAGIKYSVVTQEYLESNGNANFAGILDQIVADATARIPASDGSPAQAKVDQLRQLLSVSIPSAHAETREGYKALYGEVAKDVADAQNISAAYSSLAGRGIETPETVTVTWTVAGALLMLSLMNLAVLMAISAKQTQINAWGVKKEQVETDEAILTIMSELRPISNGDLVKRLTVTEHVTGSVADRINMMTEATQEALQGVKTATREAETSMEEIFELVEEANDATETATEQAQSSRQKSKDGAAAVARAVDKINDARNLIQEVSKRVKNLGEVAQSIGSITELIEQMAEKTKVLALNTSLIASEAGEGGAKYRTLAKEIDKMSDDTKNSLTQISASVKSMQVETQMVIATVEGVTSEVVNSSQQWDEALLALSKITESSEQIESLVNALRSTTTKQAVSASTAVSVMGRLSESAQKFRTTQEEKIDA